MRGLFGACAFAQIVLLALALSRPAQAVEFGPLAGKVFGDGKRTLIVLLHGDVSKGGPANYMYSHASRMSAAFPDATVVALLRPGYPDGEGRQSKGSLNGRRDHYTSANNALVADTVASLKTAISPERTVIVGHSGGAAQTGAVVGRAPGLADIAVLVSCPCNVPQWRASRKRSAWSNSESPHSYVGKVDPKLRLIAITGANDSNTRTSLARSYVADLQRRGVEARFVEAPNAGHGYDNLAATVQSELGKLLAQ